jgi:hypothetical protein
MSMWRSTDQKHECYDSSDMNGDAFVELIRCIDFKLEEN